jgi:hypothetical protein
MLYKRIRESFDVINTLNIKEILLFIQLLFHTFELFVFIDSIPVILHGLRRVLLDL